MKDVSLVALKKLKLLLVDDDLELLESLKLTLSIFFKEVITATNGVEAFKIYETEHIDMIITDYVMPIMSGYELCLKIRETNKKIPMVIVSNFQDSEKLLKSIPLNLSQYCVKPMEYTALIDTLLILLEKMKDENLLVEILSSEISYNRIAKNILVKGAEIISLTRSEVETLELLIRYKNSIVSNEMVMLALDPTEDKSEKSIKNIIYRLRKKIGKELIVNVQSLGYILRDLH